LATPFSPPMLRSRVHAWLSRASAQAARIVTKTDAANAPDIRARPSPEELEKRLSAVPIFKTLTPDEIRLLAESGEERVFGPGHTIVHQHDRGEQAYVVLSGRVRVLEESEEQPRGDIAIAELGTGEIFGEMAALTDRYRSATVVAVEE